MALLIGAGCRTPLDELVFEPADELTPEQVDLTGDGLLDILMAGLDAFILPGGEPFSVDSLIQLPVTGQFIDSAIADLDGDGLPDVVLGNVFDDQLEYETVSYVLIAQGFDPPTWEITELPTMGAHGVSTADVDLDGWRDIVVSNHGQGNIEDGEENIDFLLESVVFLGGADGFDPDRRIALPTQGAFGNAALDINGDDWPDLVFANYFDGQEREIDSVVYWGSERGFDVERRTDLPTAGARDVGVYDLDHDGYLDLFFTAHFDGEVMDVDSVIYWGGPEGYGVEHSSLLGTHGAHSLVVADLDGDDLRDLVFANARGDDHWETAVPTWVVLQDEQGWDTSAPLELAPDWGHGLAVGQLGGGDAPDLIVGSYRPRRDDDDRHRQNGLYAYWDIPESFAEPPEFLQYPAGVRSVSAFADEQGF